MFEPHLKSFFVHSNDSTHIKMLKVNIIDIIILSMCYVVFQNIITVLYFIFCYFFFSKSLLFVFVLFFKLEIMTNIASETNISLLLREFQVGYMYYLL